MNYIVSSITTNFRVLFHPALPSSSNCAFCTIILCKELLKIDSRLEGNQLTGIIPSDIGSLSELLHLALKSNKLTGQIPLSIGGLSKVEYIDLSRNQLTGTIPSTIGNLPMVINIALYQNRLSGLIPSSIANPSTLRYLSLYDNALTGVPLSLSARKFDRLALLPNPMTHIPYDLQIQNPASAINQANLTSFLNIRVLKRQTSSTVGITNLLKMCPLDSISESRDIVIGCLAGVVYSCQSGNWYNCRNYYDSVFTNSMYAPILTCSAWNKGFRSAECVKAIGNFADHTEYSEIDKHFARWFVSTLFGNPLFAPCDATKVKCTW